MKPTARVLDSLASAVTVRGHANPILIILSFLSAGAFAGALTNVLSAAGQCLLYPWFRHNLDPRTSFFNAAQQALLPAVFFAAVGVALWINARRNALPLNVETYTPPPHEGLLAVLSRYNDRNGRCSFTTLADARAALQLQSAAHVRDELLGSNFGPLVVALEHHQSALRRCWLIVTREASIDFDHAEAVLQALVPHVRFDRVDIGSAYDVPALAARVAEVWREAVRDPEVKGRVIADITGGTAVMSGGIVASTLSEDRKVEYLRQDVQLRENGKALTAAEISARRLLMAVDTSPALVRDLFNQH